MFLLTIDEKEVAGFNEVSGLAVETEVETLREGGVNHTEWQIPGPAKFPSRLVLKRGLGDLSYLWDWYRGIATGQIQRRNIAINLNASQGTGTRAWVFREACPVKWTGPELRASTSAIAFEAIELVHRGLMP
jgi:phage tail-like protein